MTAPAKRSAARRAPNTARGGHHPEERPNPLYATADDDGDTEAAKALRDYARALDRCRTPEQSHQATERLLSAILPGRIPTTPNPNHRKATP